MHSALRSTLMLCALAVAGVAQAQTLAGRAETVYTWRGSLGARGLLTIRNYNGPIDVKPASGSQVELRAEKNNERGRGDIRDVAFEVDNRNGDVTICSVYRDNNPCDENNGRRRNRDDRDWDNRYVTVSMTVFVPKGAEVRISTGNGAVTIQQVTADVRASTGNGRVTVANAEGTVQVSTGNGDVSVRDSKGSVRVSTGNGRVNVNTSTGPVEASTGSGDIDVSMAALSSRDDMTFRTGNGDVRVTLPAGYNGELDATTGNGHIQSDFDLKIEGRLNPHRIRATIGSGGSRLRLSSGNGRLEIRKA